MHPMIKLLLATAFLANFAEGLYTPIYAVFVEQVGGKIEDAGLSWSVNLIIFGLLAILFSHIERKGKKALFLATGYLLAFVATIAFTIASSPLHLYAVQFLRGISWALLSPVWDSFFTKFVSRKRATVEWGYYEGGWSIATGLGAALGGITVSLFGFKFLFTVSAFLFLASAALVLAYRKELETTSNT